MSWSPVLGVQPLHGLLVRRVRHLEAHQELLGRAACLGAESQEALARLHCVWIQLQESSSPGHKVLVVSSLVNPTFQLWLAESLDGLVLKLDHALPLVSQGSGEGGRVAVLLRPRGLDSCLQALHHTLEELEVFVSLILGGRGRGCRDPAPRRAAGTSVSAALVPGVSTSSSTASSGGVWGRESRPCSPITCARLCLAFLLVSSRQSTVLDLVASTKGISRQVHVADDGRGSGGGGGRWHSAFLLILPSPGSTSWQVGRRAHDGTDVLGFALLDCVKSPVGCAADASSLCLEPEGELVRSPDGRRSLLLRCLWVLGGEGDRDGVHIGVLGGEDLVRGGGEVLQGGADVGEDRVVRLFEELVD